MSITIEIAQANLDALTKAYAGNPGSLSSVSINGRSVSFRSMSEVIEGINYWSRIVASLKRESLGESRHGVSYVDFR